MIALSRCVALKALRDSCWKGRSVRFVAPFCESLHFGVACFIMFRKCRTMSQAFTYVTAMSSSSSKASPLDSGAPAADMM